MLFDLERDIGETKDVAGRNPDVVKKLLKLAELARKDIGDYNRIGKNSRFYDSGIKRGDIKARQKKLGR